MLNVLSNLINNIKPNTIDMNTVHKNSNMTNFQKIENWNVVIKAAKEGLNCTAVNINPDDCVHGRVRLIIHWSKNAFC